MGGGSGGWDRRPSNDSSGTEDGKDDDESPAVSPPERDEEGPDESSEEQEENSTDDGGGESAIPISTPDSEDDDSANDEDTEDESDAEERSEGEDEPDDAPNGQDEEDHGEEAEEDEPLDDDQEEEEECVLSEVATLHSPNPDALQDTTKNDVYSVRATEDGIIVVDWDGRTVGGIAEPWVSTLRECLEQGYSYRARIIDLDGGSCKIRVTNKCLVQQRVELTELNEDAVDRVISGATLDVNKVGEDIVVLLEDEERLGVLPHPWSEIVSDCIEQEFQYIAVVQTCTAEECEVELQTAPENPE